MRNLTITDLVDEIAQLQIGTFYEYYSHRSRVRIIEIRRPEGPILIETDSKGSNVRSGTISREQLAKMAFFCSARPDYPLHVDRIFSAGGNTRSALETLLAYTPNFFICFPKRVDIYTGEILQNLKHIMWCPDQTHSIGQLQEKQYDQLVTEAFDFGVDFGEIRVTQADLAGTDFNTIEAKTTHVQMQIALIEIGNALNFETWIAKNDRSIQVRDTTLGSLKGVIESLDEISILHKKDMKEKALQIDCIWFAEDRTRIPAVMEIEHSTDVRSGLTRMSKLKETLGDVSPTFAVVAPDQRRNKVVLEANEKHYRTLKARFMPYSAVRELYSLVKRYSLTDIVDYRFVHAFMEQVVHP